MNNDPYAPPAVYLNDAPPPLEVEGGMSLAEAEALRREHLSHEARLRAFGSLTLLWAMYLLLGPPMILLGLLLLLLAPFAEGEVMRSFAVALVVCGGGSLFVAVGALGVRAGSGLRRLDPQHKVLYSIFAGFFLLSCSAPALLGLWGLYLIHSPAGALVLSPAYHEARRLTPHIAEESSPGSWIAFTLLLFVLPAVITLLVAT